MGISYLYHYQQIYVLENINNHAGNFNQNKTPCTFIYFINSYKVNA